MLHLAWIVPLVLLIAFVGSPRFRGEIAQTRVRRVLEQALEKNRYTLMHNVLFPSGGGTIKIDHLVVSRFGVFVIDSVYARGWISGTDVQDRWKRSAMGRTHRMENPVHSNRVHAETLGSRIGLASPQVHRLVVLDGSRGFRHTPPVEIVAPEQLVPRIRRFGQHVLESEQAETVLRELRSLRLEPGKTSYLKRPGFILTVLLAGMALGLYFAYHDDLTRFFEQQSLNSQMRDDPASFHPDGHRKSEIERWEDSLRCAYSPDTNRCACYEPDGGKVDIELSRCRDLAERGSVLKQ
ncbi:MAG: NERD domain-containing protein [Xanthomonadales bacterium]|nr:NERD domain-containing protein [Xanthomonadales bacterium]